MATPSTVPPPTPLVRMIGESKWLAGVMVLQANPDQKECWVAEHCSGYKYILERKTDTQYVQKTYAMGVLVSERPMEVNASLIPPGTTPFAGNLMDPNASADAYVNMFK